MEKRNFLKSLGLAAVAGTFALAEARQSLAATVLTNNSVTTESIIAPVGKTASVVVAAFDSPAQLVNTADIKCDGSADDVDFQAIIDAMPSYGGVVVFLPGTYHLYSTLDFKGKSYIHFIGYGATFVRHMTTSMFVNNSGSFGTARIASASYGIGTRDVVLASVSNFSVGSIVRVVDLNNVTYEHMDRVEAIDTTTKTLTLQRGLKWGFTSGVSNVVPCNNICVGITFEGITFTDSVFETTSNDSMIELKYMADYRFIDVNFKNIAGFACIRMWYAIDGIFDRIRIDNVIHSTLGYGIDLMYATTGVTISNSIINGCRHAVTADRVYDVLHSNVIANGKTTLANTAQSFDTHQYCKDFQYVNCQSNGAFGGLNIRGQRVNVVNFMCNATSYSGLVLQATSRDVTINNFQIHNPGVWGENVTVPIIQLCAKDTIIKGLKVIQDSAAYSNTMDAIVATDCNNVIIDGFIIDDRLQTEIVNGVSMTGTNTRLHLLNGFINTYRTGKAVILDSSSSYCKVNNVVALQEIQNSGTNNTVA